MLDNNSLIILAYLKNHFQTSDKPVTALDININGLNLNDIDKAIEILDNNGRINLTERNYIRPSVESVND
ncbi:hypothetical protein [Clostridium sp.]|uniref:hypothetical protein n=1 Tax=Clostridium sp. TaxID=1506 RepID=UPI00321806E1